MKRLLSIILSLSMFGSFPVTAFAAEPVSNTSDLIEYSTIYDEVNNTVQAVQYNTTTCEYQYGPVIAIESADESEMSPSALGADVHQDTFLNFEYDIWYGSPNEWRLERPDGAFAQYYFKVYETDSNLSYLNDWKDDVNNLNAQEWAVLGGLGLSVFNVVKAAIISHAAIASGGILTAGAIEAIKDAAVSAGGTAVGVGLLCTTFNDCNRSYLAVADHSIPHP